MSFNNNQFFVLIYYFNKLVASFMVKKLLNYSVYALCIFCNLLHAQSLDNCNKHLDSLLHSPKYKVDVYKGKIASKTILDAQTRRFRTNLRQVLALNPKVEVAGQFGVTSWGCGSPCLNLGFVSLNTGKASIGPYYANGVEYLPNSQIIITDRAESQEQIDRVKWLIPQAYHINEDGKFKLVHKCKLDRKANK